MSKRKRGKCPWCGRTMALIPRKKGRGGLQPGPHSNGIATGLYCFGYTTKTRVKA